MLGDLLRPGWPFFGLKIFEPSEENPYCVAMNSAEPKVSLFT